MAITRTNQFTTVMGDLVVACDYLDLDGSATTVTLPVGTIVYAELGQCGTIDAGVSASWSGTTLTLSGAGISNQYAYVLYFGTA